MSSRLLRPPGAAAGGTERHPGADWADRHRWRERQPGAGRWRAERTDAIATRMASPTPASHDPFRLVAATRRAIALATFRIPGFAGPKVAGGGREQLRGRQATAWLKLSREQSRAERVACSRWLLLSARLRDPRRPRRNACGDAEEVPGWARRGMGGWVDGNSWEDYATRSGRPCFRRGARWTYFVGSRSKSGENSGVTMRECGYTR